VLLPDVRGRRCVAEVWFRGTSEWYQDIYNARKDVNRFRKDRDQNVLVQVQDKQTAHERPAERKWWKERQTFTWSFQIDASGVYVMFGAVPESSGPDRRTT